MILFVFKQKFVYKFVVFFPFVSECANARVEHVGSTNLISPVGDAYWISEPGAASVAATCSFVSASRRVATVPCSTFMAPATSGREGSTAWKTKKWAAMEKTKSFRFPNQTHARLLRYLKKAHNTCAFAMLVMYICIQTQRVCHSEAYTYTRRLYSCLHTKHTKKKKKTCSAHIPDTFAFGNRLGSNIHAFVVIRYQTHTRTLLLVTRHNCICLIFCDIVHPNTYAFVTKPYMSPRKVQNQPGNPWDAYCSQKSAYCSLRPFTGMPEAANYQIFNHEFNLFDLTLCGAKCLP